MIDATNKNRQDVHRRRRIRRAASRSRGVEGKQGWQRRIVDTKKPTIIGSVRRKRDFQEVTAKERDFIGASARLAPFSSLLNQRLCDEVFQREAASQDLIDAYLNHISRKSRLPLFPDVSFSCPLLPAGATPRFSSLHPHPWPFLFRYAPLSLFLRTFSSCLISLRSCSVAGFLFWSLILRGEDAASNLRGFERKSSFPRWRSSLFCSSAGPDSGAYGSVSFPRVPASNLIPADRCRDLARILPPFRV